MIHAASALPQCRHAGHPPLQGVSDHARARKGGQAVISNNFCDSEGTMSSKCAVLTVGRAGGMHHEAEESKRVLVELSCLGFVCWGVSTIRVGDLAPAYVDPSMIRQHVPSKQRVG
jgi:hypothetical protein